MRKILFLTLLSMVVLSSCDRKVSKDTGTLDLRIAELGDFITVETKATDYTDFSNYDVVIEGPTKYQSKFSAFQGEVVELGSGNYTITVTSPDTDPVAFEQPIYQAYEEFVIKAGEVTPLDLECTPLNCKVTIELSENFVKELATYEVVVGNGLGELVWSKNDEKNDFADGKAGYFLPRGLEIKVKGYRSIDNTEATAVHYVKNPKAADHHIIKLDAKVTGQIGGVTIDVSTDFTPHNQDVNVDGMDEVYQDRPDFGDDDEDSGEEEPQKNEIIWSSNPTFSDVILTADTQIQMTIKMPAGISSFVVNVSDNFKPLVKAITTNNVEYIDLINDPKILTNFADTPLPTGDEIKDQTEVLFDLTSFVSMLLALQNDNDQTVVFVLEAYDNYGVPLLFMDEKPTVTMIIPKKAN